jgi:hypothetical protein
MGKFAGLLGAYRVRCQFFSSASIFIFFTFPEWLSFFSACYLRLLSDRSRPISQHGAVSPL